MKKIFFYLAAFLFCLVVTYKLFFYFDYKSEKAAIASNIEKARLTPEEFALIEEGDFILRRGFGFFSDFISKNLNEGAIDVTHAGIIVKQNNSLYVIHSLSSDVSDTDGVQIQRLSEFLNHSAPGKIIVTRAKNCNTEMGSKIAAMAFNYLVQHIPFDHSGDYDNADAFFCTEMIWKILEKDLRHTKIPVNPAERKTFFYSMNPMYDTLYFDIKINQYAMPYRKPERFLSEVQEH